jgi:class 3 adenylate cyclase/tetratricopeptide (TPR) repeat protein
MQCPSCAAELVAAARFCSSCGHAVAATQVEERRIVTVLFGDVVGFTALAEHLDPEQVKRLIDRAFQRLVDDVTAFGGRVDKLLGDGILALFGAPVAHEDDAERAVRAGLRMQQSMARFAQQSSLDQPLQMRIGINTGEVLVGNLAGTDYTAMGDVVNTASRLQSEAPPGGVLVGEATFALTSGIIEYGPLAELQPRGRENSISTWLAVDTLAPPGSRQRRSDLRLVGRDAELGLARSAMHLALAERRSVMLNVLGESGVGKTRLIDELLATLDELGMGEVQVLEGVCAPYGESNVWAPIATALTTHLGLDPSLSGDEVRQRAVAKATRLMAGDAVPLTDPFDARHPEVDRAAEVFLHLLGYESALDSLDITARRDVVQRTIARVVELRSEATPLVLWIDDLHWADQVVLDVLEHLAGSVTRVPFVLVTSMRPGSEVVWPPNNDRTTIVSLTVHPLARADSDELASELLGEMVLESATDQSLLGALFDRSGGNPLFLQQLARVVVDQGPSSELPDSLRALIAARLDQLNTLERQVLDNAATLGLSGSVKALERFAEKMHQQFDRFTLGQLDAKGFLELDGQKWKFRSDSVREATYQTLTKASRAQRHAGVAASIASHSPTALDDLAHHTATAAELVADLGQVDGVPGGIRADAVRYLTAAAERARDTGSQRSLVRHTSRALALLDGQPDDIERRTRLALLRCSGLIEMRNFADARGAIDQVLADAVQCGDIETEGAARRLLGMLLHLQGDQAGAREQLGTGVELLRTTDAVALLADALRQRGFIELFGGSLVDAEWFFGEAEAEYLRLDDERGLAYIEQHRAWVSFLSGDLALADERLHSAADTLNRLGDRNGVGWAFGLLAFVRFFQRRFVEAEDLASVVGAEAMDRGDDWAAAMMQTLLADLRLWQGNLTEALGNAEQARSRFKRIGDKFGMVQSLSALVRIQVALGRTSALQRSVEELLSLADNSPLGPLPVLAVAGAAMHHGDGQVALNNVERGLDSMETLTAGGFEAMVVRTIAFAQLGRFDEALAALESIDAESMEHPFAQAGAAIAYSLAGDSDAALAAADAVAAAGATYLDRAIAAVAAAGAHSALGDRSAAQGVLSQALTECLEVGDVVAITLLQRTHLHVLGEAHASGQGDETAIGEGWLTVIAALPVLQHAA